VEIKHRSKPTSWMGRTVCQYRANPATLRVMLYSLRLHNRHRANFTASMERESRSACIATQPPPNKLTIRERLERIRTNPPPIIEGLEQDLFSSDLDKN
jgi:hypothetical protein